MECASRVRVSFLPSDRKGLWLSSDLDGLTHAWSSVDDGRRGWVPTGPIWNGCRPAGRGGADFGLWATFSASAIARTACAGSNDGNEPGNGGWVWKAESPTHGFARLPARCKIRRCHADCRGIRIFHRTCGNAEPRPLGLDGAAAPCFPVRGARCGRVWAKRRSSLEFGSDTAGIPRKSCTAGSNA